MKNPNGYGTVVKLSGNRRNPWTAKVTTGWTEDGKQIIKYLGYYPKKIDAMDALVDYNLNPYTATASDVTFRQLYKMWLESKQDSSISYSTLNGYKTAYKYSEPLYEMTLAGIKLRHLQDTVNNVSSESTQRRMKVLYSLMYSYAVKNDMIDASMDKTSFIEVKPQGTSDKHYRFTDKEIGILWGDKDDPDTQIILMLIYTGTRPNELFSLKKKDVNLEEHYFHIQNGKTKSATRDVPIHDAVYPFFESFMKNEAEHLIVDSNLIDYSYESQVHYVYFCNNIFNVKLESLGILYYEKNGEKRQHFCYDTRHTFASLWAENHLNEMYRRRIQGHSAKGIGEEVYTHLNISSLLEEVNKLPICTQ